jgi:two-component system, OmpR family, alkaline phosphatase synthesis response regulator PhoP
MDSDTQSLGQSYVVPCFSCQASFDALAGAWCGCLTSKRTLVCPACRNCFCKAPTVYKQDFWEKAPQAMWDRATADRHAIFDPPPNPPPASVTRPLVLVVDDEPEIQRATLMAISELGYGAVLAHDGLEGLQFASRYRPDLVLTDAFMPKLDGREMCRRLKSNPATAGIKVVLMTAVYTAARYRSEAFREFNADEYLSKPIDLKDLSQVLRRLLVNEAAAAGGNRG